jgi:uncharacterized repeat protein (TIGR01451 family)
MSTRRVLDSRFARVGPVVIVLLLLTLSTLMIVSAPNVDNMLDNPGFEEPNPANWESKDEDFPGLWSYSWPSSPVHSGNHSIGIDINLNTYDGWWQSTPSVPITATRPFTFSGWIRTEEVDNQAFLTLVFQDADGREIKLANSSAVSNSTDWVQVRPSEPIVAPIDAVSAHIRCHLSGRGTAWYDDILLRPESGDFARLEIEKSTQPTTAKAGGLLTYTLMYSNTGNALAEDVTIVDSLPPSVTIVYSSPTASEQPEPHTLIWNVSSLAEGGMPQTITVVVMVNLAVVDGQWLTNTATIVGEMAGLDTAWITTEVAVSSMYQTYLPGLMKSYPPPRVINGGFEDGWTGWAHEGNTSILSDYPFSGNYSARLGNPDYNCKGGVPIGRIGSIEQTVSVPSTTSPKLSFWYRIFTHDRNSKLSDDYDSFDVRINGMLVFRDMNQTDPYGCGNLRDLGWMHAIVDLSSYRGSYIIIRFEDWNRFDSWYNTWTYVDDVQIDP